MTKCALVLTSEGAELFVVRDSPCSRQCTLCSQIKQVALCRCLEAMFFSMPRESDGMGGQVYVKEDESSKCPLLPASTNWGFLNLRDAARK